MSSPALALLTAMRNALLADNALNLLLGGAHVYEELPRGAPPTHVSFGEAETRDWSTADQKAHEHFVTISIRTNSRSRSLAQNILSEIETALDGAALVLTGHRLVNLRLTFWSVSKDRSGETFNATARFRAATEPN